MATSVMTLWLDHTRHLGPPPEWLRFVTYNILGRIICYGKLCGTLRYQHRSDEDEEALKHLMHPDGGTCLIFCDLRPFKEHFVKLEQNKCSGPLLFL